jgi:competence protein ComEA
MPHRTSRTPRAEHDAAVARRLQLLGQELAAVRAGPPSTVVPEPSEASEAPVDAWGLDGHTRVAVRDGPRDDPAPQGVGEEPRVVPRPGRHASRRPRGAALLPDTLQGRVALGPGALAVVAVVVALGLGVTAWWVVRSEPTPVAPVTPRPAEGLASPAVPPPAAGDELPEDGAGTATGTVTVDVAGRVRRPGIVVLDLGARVVDALERAGGARPGVDLAGLNLARVLVDGEQVVVGVPPPATGLPAGASAPPGAPTGALVDLNTADLVALESLPEVGPVTAQAILTWREAHGGFTAVSELLEVDGIGDATLATITPFVTV